MYCMYTSITQACDGLPSPITAILSSPDACVNIIFENESITDWQLSLLNQSISLIIPRFEAFYQICKTLLPASKTYLNLHLQVLFEVRQQRQEDGERQLEHVGDGRNAVLRESDTQVLFDCIDKHLVGAEHRASVL